MLLGRVHSAPCCPPAGGRAGFLRLHASSLQRPRLRRPTTISSSALPSCIPGPNIRAQNNPLLPQACGNSYHVRNKACCPVGHECVVQPTCGGICAEVEQPSYTWAAMLKTCLNQVCGMHLVEGDEGLLGAVGVGVACTLAGKLNAPLLLLMRCMLKACLNRMGFA